MGALFPASPNAALTRRSARHAVCFSCASHSFLSVLVARTQSNIVVLLRKLSQSVADQKSGHNGRRQADPEKAENPRCLSISRRHPWNFHDRNIESVLVFEIYHVFGPSLDDSRTVALELGCRNFEEHFLSTQTISFLRRHRNRHFQLDCLTFDSTLYCFACNGKLHCRSTH